MEFKALVADSSTKTRKNITRSLNEIGVRDVVEATDGENAFELVKNGKFDVIFTEWNYKNNAGETLIDAVRKINQKMPVIVTAPSKKLEDLRKSCPTATNYLTMPFTTDQLRKTVAQYVPSIAG
jgi:two-component system chemotaxis response regulator CheY